MMKAIVQDRYGPPEVLQLREIEKPAATGDQVLVRVRAASVHPDVWHVVTGQRVLVNGAGGGVGMVAVQLAKAYGAEVTGVDTAAKLELVRSLGADRVIDYRREDFTRAGERYHLIFDVPGNRPLADCRRALTPDGTYILIGHDHFGGVGRRWLGSLPRFLKLMALSPFVNQLPNLRFSTPSKRELMATLTELLEAGKLTPVVDRTYPLRDVPAAIRYLMAGEARGRVIVTVS